MVNRESERNDASTNSEADAPGLQRGWGANLSERRRREAVELVRDRVTELEAMLERAAPGSGVRGGGMRLTNLNVPEPRATSLSSASRTSPSQNAMVVD